MLIIDRFEGDVAVCEDEDRRIVEMDRSLLPEGAKADRRERIKRLQDSLWESESK